MKHEDRTFTDIVELDGEDFSGCTFDNCLLIYRGGAPPAINGCSFNSFTFEFRDHAANTVAFLRAMANPNSGLQKIIRDTFPGLSAHWLVEARPE